MKKTGAGTIIVACSCVHAGQDLIHGQGRRVANLAPGREEGSVKRYRCTVCLREHLL